MKQETRGGLAPIAGRTLQRQNCLVRVWGPAIPQNKQSWLSVGRHGWQMSLDTRGLLEPLAASGPFLLRHLPEFATPGVYYLTFPCLPSQKLDVSFTRFARKNYEFSNQGDRVDSINRAGSEARNNKEPLLRFACQFDTSLGTGIPTTR
jgi:hypothetical protein